MCEYGLKLKEYIDMYKTKHFQFMNLCALIRMSYSLELMQLARRENGELFNMRNSAEFKYFTNKYKKIQLNKPKQIR